MLAAMDLAGTELRTKEERYVSKHRDNCDHARGKRSVRWTFKRASRHTASNIAEQAHPANAQTSLSANLQFSAAWWLTRPEKTPKTQKGKTGPTPEHKNKSHTPKPPKSSQH